MSEWSVDLWRAIERIRAGGLVVLLDHPDRENEGDLVGAAALMTPETINFMLTHARGAFVAAFMPSSRCRELELPPAISPEQDQALNATRFRVSVDAAGSLSGSSAAERAETVRILGAADSRAADLVRPGHVVPIEAHENGLAGRRGHTEAGVALMELAGIEPPVAVDLEILDPAGGMADREWLARLAQEFDLPMVTVDELAVAAGADREPSEGAA